MSGWTNMSGFNVTRGNNISNQIKRMFYLRDLQDIHRTHIVSIRPNSKPQDSTIKITCTRATSILPSFVVTDFSALRQSSPFYSVASYSSTAKIGSATTVTSKLQN